MSRELAALAAIEIDDWAQTPDAVWALPGYHVDGLHPGIVNRLTASLDAVTKRGTPAAVVIRGQKGTGKTHLLNWTRRQIQRRKGYFFLVKLVAGSDIWESAVNSVFDGLLQRDDNGGDQLTRLLTTLADGMGLAPATHAAVTGRTAPAPAHLDAFITGLRGLDRQVGLQAADTARALVLCGAPSDAAQIGSSYFSLIEADERRPAWGILGTPTGQLVVRDLTRLIALAGPTVFAVDQLDAVVDASSVARGDSRRSGENAAAKRIRDEIAVGLMNLREESRRSLIVVACQRDTWDMIATSSLLSAVDRFDVYPDLEPVPSARIAERIIGARFAPAYAATGFVPDYETWPVTKAFLAEAAHRLTARKLLTRVHHHISGCLSSGTVTELTSLSDPEPATSVPAPAAAGREELTSLDALFEELCEAADVRGPLSPEREDALIPGLLGAGLRSLVLELGADPDRITVETGFGKAASLHARLRLSLDEDSEAEEHWSFRALGTGSPISYQSKLKKALAESGLTGDGPVRRMTLLRNSQRPRGEKTRQLQEEFEKLGGRSIPIGTSDLRTLSALSRLFASRPPGLDAWLLDRGMAGGTEVLASLAADLRAHGIGDRPGSEPVGGRPPAAVPEGGAEDGILLGEGLRSRQPFTVTLDRLTKHTFITGASGSGKTVLIRHLVEQCALRGVSAVVLDPNGDLAGLGDRPDPPPGDGNDERRHEAERYFADTDVVVWTPGLTAGRPLMFHPLPDFAAVRDDTDVYNRTLTAAVAALAPHAGVQERKSQRKVQQISILRRTLDLYVRDGGRGLAGFIGLLSELPDGVANYRAGAKLAAEMADTLEAASDSDPLFGETGEPVDPGILFTPAPGKRARISVISMTGLDEGSPRETFVSRLQMAVFGWFKANPVRDRQLGGLLVMDEAQSFVPASGQAASVETTKTLVSQVRKYGLGLVFATQTPKNLHNVVPGNAAIQFIGRLTVPAQLQAAEQMAQARGGSLDALGRLGPGVFFAAGEGTTFSRIQVPYCLSKDAGPLSEEEVVERARRGGDGRGPGVMRIP